MTIKFTANKYIAISALLTSIFMINGCSTISNTPGKEAQPPRTGELEYLGSISAEALNWNWFFQPSEEKRIAGLEKLAQEKAEERFGKDIILKPEAIEGEWSPLSLLMLFNTLGFAEDTGIKVSVWREKPPVRQAAPETPKEYGVRYRVIPEQNYMQPDEFVTVEYKTNDELSAELAEALDSGKISGSVYERRKKLLPETGRVFITLGREEIANAITRWFTFSCTYNGKLLFYKKGTEDIPYVYGTDRLWWNDKNYDIDIDWDGELEVAVEDGYQNKIYNFRIVKERYLIE